MILKFRKTRKAKAIERRRDEVLAVVRKGRSMCENVDYGYLSDEMTNAVKQAKALVDSHWFKHLKAASEP